MSIHNKITETAITFDDVLLIPSYSEVLPNQVSLKSKLSEKITLNVPIVSAAMDTVTEAEMAIALARVGGLGFIHKNMPVEEQAAQVNKVKRSENGMIADPVTLSKDYTLAEAKELMSRYKISGLPVVDAENKLIGIITNRDVKYQENLEAKVEELMTKDNLVTSDKNTTLEDAKKTLPTLNGELSGKEFNSTDLFIDPVKLSIKIYEYNQNGNNINRIKCLLDSNDDSEFLFMSKHFTDSLIMISDFTDFGKPNTKNANIFED